MTIHSEVQCCSTLEIEMRFKKEYSPDFKSQARTLSPHQLGTHPSGWTIVGEVWKDYYEWVNEFEATHPTLGWVRGDFESLVEAKSKKAFEHFIANHEPEEWDYWDI
jgi:hypothetical protein